MLPEPRFDDSKRRFRTLYCAIRAETALRSPTYAATPMRWPAIWRHSARKPAPTCRPRKSLPTGEAERPRSLPDRQRRRDPRPHRPRCAPPDRAAPRRPAGLPRDGPPRHRPGHGQAPRGDPRARHRRPRRARLRGDSLPLPTRRPALLRPVRGPRPTRSHRPADPVDGPPSPSPRTRCRRLGPPAPASTSACTGGEESAVVSMGGTHRSHNHMGEIGLSQIGGTPQQTQRTRSQLPVAQPVSEVEDQSTSTRWRLIATHRPFLTM